MEIEAGRQVGNIDGQGRAAAWPSGIAGAVGTASTGCGFARAGGATRAGCSITRAGDGRGFGLLLRCVVVGRPCEARRQLRTKQPCRRSTYESRFIRSPLGRAP